MCSILEYKKRLLLSKRFCRPLFPSIFRAFSFIQPLMAREAVVHPMRPASFVIASTTDGETLLSSQDTIIII